jgi:hypothetical protein
VGAVRRRDTTRRRSLLVMRGAAWTAVDVGRELRRLPAIADNELSI